MKITVLNPFTIDPVNHSDIHAIEFHDESLTTQADVEQSDINTIVRQFGVTGELPYGMRVPYSADITESPMDFHEAQNFIAETTQAFMDLPSHVRTEFENDPGNFMAFIDDPDNYAKAVKLGLVPPKPETPPPADGSSPPLDGSTTTTA